MDKNIIDEINKMTYEEMKEFSRTAPIGHEYFDMRKPYWIIFRKRMKELGEE